MVVVETSSFFRLTLIRHGQTTSNESGLLHGSTDTLLTPLGHKQAHAAGKSLRREKWSHVITSDLKRTKQTADEILSSNEDKDYARSEDPRVRERGFGTMEGADIMDFEEKKKEYREKNLGHFVPEGGETFQGNKDFTNTDEEF